MKLESKYFRFKSIIEGNNIFEIINMALFGCQRKNV